MAKQNKPLNRWVLCGELLLLQTALRDQVKQAQLQVKRWERLAATVKELADRVRPQ